MRWNTVEKHWMAFVPQILSRWPDMEEDDVDAIEGDREAFLDYLCGVGSLDREEAEDELSEWLEGAEPADAVLDESRDNENIVRSARSIGEGEDVYDDDAAFGDDDEKEEE